ncbi:MAG: helix-turn-helix domain-containing protein [Chloroflexota bacterium]|nr:helix-turn-helix domain-containing protein [Chloroflexota bacterium]
MDRKEQDKLDEARNPSLDADGQPVVDAATPVAPLEGAAVLLTDGHITTMSSAHYQALREAVSKNTFHQTEGSPWPTAQLDKGRASGLAQLRPPAVDEEGLLPPDEVALWAELMWRQREELSDLDADALDALSAIWLSQARSVQQSAVADVDGLLAMRGLKPKRSGQGRRGGYEREQRAAILRALSHIQNLWLNMAELEVFEETSLGRRRPTKRAVQSRAFVITDRAGQLRIDGYIEVDRFLFRPGEVFGYFLLGPGRQTALLSAKALSYDPHNQTWEKRLTRYLSWQWRTQARGGMALRPFRVATLMDAAGEAIDSHHPVRTRDRLEKCLDRLQSDGVIAMWQYDNLDESAMGRRGWIQEWLQWTLLIEPPEIVREQYGSLDQKRAVPLRTPDSDAGLIEQVKLKRKTLRLSQLRAAEEIGVSQGYLNTLERGMSTPSEKMRKRLQEWLDRAS